jgi:hypothetical protein
MVKNIGLDVSFDNMYDWKRKLQNAGVFNNTKAYISNDETVEFLNGFYCSEI